METGEVEKKSKVKLVTFKKEFQGRDQKQKYVFIIEFENGDKGEYVSLKRDQMFFKEGIETSYKKKTAENHGHIDVSINPIYTSNVSSGNPGGNPGGNSRSRFEKNYPLDFISFSASYTKDLMVAGKLPKKKVGAKMEEMKFAECFEYIYSVMEKKYKEVTNANTNPETK